MKFQGKILIGSGSLIGTIDNKSYQVNRDHPMYRKLLEAFKNDDAAEFVRLQDEKQTLENYVKEEVPASAGVTVGNDGTVYYKGTQLINPIVDTIKTMMSHGLDFKPMVRLLERAMKSGSHKVVNELFKFLEACGCTITEDGCFLAYKTVDSDYMDKYSHTICNKVGSPIPRKERWEVDDNCSRTCSKGYHVGALAYAGPGGWYNSSSDHVMICKVPPEDVVAVPNDHSGQKLRVCWYEVVGEFQSELKSTVYSGKVGGDYSQGIEGRAPRVQLAFDDMVVDGVYTALYTNKRGEQRQRYFVVHEVYGDHVIVELMEPEDNVGKIRRFNVNQLAQIFEWDGDVEDEVEEDSYECEYCSDYDCDGYCDEADEDDDYETESGGCYW